jgi:ribosomal protein S18 acetylase RimI-like enzyme
MPEREGAVKISFRPARLDDLEYCARLYFAAMTDTIRALKLDLAAHRASFRERWDVAEVRLITLDNADIGWLQSRIEEDALFLAQLFIDAPFQGRGIGTEVMHRLIAEGGAGGRAITLGVVKTNPALRLYERLGFRITHEDDRKFYMRRAPATPGRHAAPPLS